jgi:hypothetical protein
MLKVPRTVHADSAADWHAEYSSDSLTLDYLARRPTGAFQPRCEILELHFMFHADLRDGDLYYAEALTDIRYPLVAAERSQALRYSFI